MSNTVLVTPQADDKPKKSWHDFIAEYLVLAMIGISTVSICVLVEIKDAILQHNTVVDRQIQLGHANALIVERALARLEGREPAPQAENFRLNEVVEPEVLNLSK